ncbi:E3 ubiquitin-protein ligase TRIM65 isoform X2 [Colius striatus]|uniref:E3 ubiquitin-protein ligase TRIM65 isoform X2 n=1 Tax=Colius striatus TaxID=57412 RepID=UPI002B1E2D1D|nr:E3 ubiquitin-protein ligase TRIM65 isoform X2 [Colius striatus]
MRAAGRMASQRLEEKLVCSICLELFRVPVTLPCGHNFCKLCISNHWQQQQAPAGAEKGYTCPDCRREFERCPELKKNVTLCSVVELAQEEEAGAPGTAGTEAARGELCPQHGRPLELYCEEEQRCICCVCTARHCQRHRRLLLEEERAKKQALLQEFLEKKQEESERIKQWMQELEQQTQSIKDSSEQLRSVILNKFTVLRKSLEDFQWQTVTRIEKEQEAALGQVGENWSILKDHLDSLGQHRERAQSLLACPDHRTFLQEFPLLPSPESPEPLLPVEFDVATVIKPVIEILTNISRLLLEDLPDSVPSQAPDPMDQDHRNLTFDPETANKYLELSKGNRRVRHSPSPSPGRQEQGPRFQPWQVLCTQGYGHGHHYWEVNISSHMVILGVTYPGLPRERQQGHTFNIGLDGGSWGLQVREDGYLAWHQGRPEKIQSQLYKDLGVSLDYSKGLLSFYGLGERTRLIHSFHNVFTEPLYPVFWLCEGRVVTLRWRD